MGSIFSCVRFNEIVLKVPTGKVHLNLATIDQLIIMQVIDCFAGLVRAFEEDENRLLVATVDALFDASVPPQIAHE